jgi:putative endonuclease
MPKPGYVYLLASRRDGTLYIGVTSDLPKRMWEHRHAPDGASFTSRYAVDRLVYYEVHRDIRDAIVREKQLKK